MLLEAKADAGVRNEHMESPLHRALQTNQGEGLASVPSLLINRGKALGCQDSNGNTAATIAQQKGWTRTFELLSEAGALELTPVDKPQEE